MKLTEIREHWENAGLAMSLKSAVTPTSRDPFLAKLEAENISYYLKKSFNVLEVGCGDCAHSIGYARKVKTLTAVDIATSILSHARRQARKFDIDNISFANSSILDVRKLYPGGSFDCVISQRCLINLPTWVYQHQAIVQIGSVLREDGLFLLSEGFHEGLVNLNAIRRSLGLTEIRTVKYNRLLKRGSFERLVSKYFEIIDIKDYGLYFLLSRVFHPLYVYPREPKHASKFNALSFRLFREASPAKLENYSLNLFYILRKKRR